MNRGANCFYGLFLLFAKGGFETGPYEGLEGNENDLILCDFGWEKSFCLGL